MDFTQQAVDNLVRQFSSALDFYRELVQNSIDAGSSAVEIWLDFVPDAGEGPEGVIEIHVDDFGEGMSEAIIDGQLTTLFSSSKEDDLTKIGKFGIGFVSVFAIGPRGVLVHTGRDGEYWEVFFDADRSFFKAPLEQAVEGTQITLFLAGDRARYTELVAASRLTLDHWCRHSEAEISFEDRASQAGGLELINRPFAVEGACVTNEEREGTQIVLAYSRTPVWGFYNKGLALAVTRVRSDLIPDRFAHISFRIKSRYLEHTLSRETVMRDANYDKAMALVAEAAAGPLRAALVAAIVELVERASGGRSWGAGERARYFELVGYLGGEGAAALAECEQRPLLLGLDGRSHSLASMARAAARHGRVFIADEASPVIDRLLAQGTPVYLVAAAAEHRGEGLAEGYDPVAQVIASYLSASVGVERVVDRLRSAVTRESSAGAWTRAAELLARPEQVLVGVDVVDEAAPQQLLAAADAVLRRGLPAPTLLGRAWRRVVGTSKAVGYDKLVAARLQGGPRGRMPLFVVGARVSPLMALPVETTVVGSQRPEAAVNVDHRHFRALLELAELDVELAGYCLARSLMLAQGEDEGLVSPPTGG